MKNLEKARRDAGDGAPDTLSVFDLCCPISPCSESNRNMEHTYTPRERRAAARAIRWLPHMYRRIPTSLRHVGPYHEACARLQNRGVGPLTRASNRFWMGG